MYELEVLYCRLATIRAVPSCGRSRNHLDAGYSYPRRTTILSIHERSPVNLVAKQAVMLGGGTSDFVQCEVLQFPRSVLDRGLASRLGELSGIEPALDGLLIARTNLCLLS